MNNLTHVGALSFAKFLGLTSSIVAFVCMIPYVLITVLFAGLLVNSGEGGAATMGIGLSLGMVIVGSLAFGVLNFISGLIYALVINFVLRKIGGLKVSIEKIG